VIILKSVQSQLLLCCESMVEQKLTWFTKYLFVVESLSWITYGCCNHNYASPWVNQRESPTDDSRHNSNKVSPSRLCSLFYCCYELNDRPICGVIISPHYVRISQAQDDLQWWISATDTLGAICCSNNAVSPWFNQKESRTDDPQQNNIRFSIPLIGLFYCCCEFNVICDVISGVARRVWGPWAPGGTLRWAAFL